MSSAWGRAAIASLVALACARMAPPPGGPPDTTEPVVTARRPDSSTVLPDYRGDAEFIFDGIISEGSAPNYGLGTGTLEALVILSPTTEVPVVRWRRNRLAVRPREGWQNGRVYRIELLPGVTDLRNNRMTGRSVITFSTGAVQPRTVLSGRIVDWSTRRPFPAGVVQALLLPDSLPYRTVADSMGRFEFGPLPAGEYLVSGGIDQNRNIRLDGTEAFDTVRVAAGTVEVGDIWAFRHDTLGPRIQALSARDSLSIGVTFQQNLDPRQPFERITARVLLLPDSTPVPVEGIYAPAIYDSVFATRLPPPVTAADSARADSLRLAQARRDSLRADSLAVAAEREALRAAEDARRGIARRSDAPGAQRQLEVLTTRPALFDRLVIRLDTVLLAGGRYVVEVTGARNPNGASTTTLLVLAVPVRAAPPPPRDTAAAPPDTTPASGRNRSLFRPAPRRP